MHDGPAIATLVLVAAWFAAREILAQLEHRNQRAAIASLLQLHLAHWQYAADEWQAHCERVRRDLWFHVLLPVCRFLAPALVLAIALSAILEPHPDLAPGLVTTVVATIGLAAAWVLVGPPLREFVSQSLRRRLHYEVYVGEPGVLEVWRDGDHIEAMEGHLYAGTGEAIERVEAIGVEPAEIVFSVGRALPWGVLHL